MTYNGSSTLGPTELYQAIQGVHVHVLGVWQPRDRHEAESAAVMFMNSLLSSESKLAQSTRCIAVGQVVRGWLDAFGLSLEEIRCPQDATSWWERLGGEPNILVGYEPDVGRWPVKALRPALLKSDWVKQQLETSLDAFTTLTSEAWVEVLRHLRQTYGPVGWRQKSVCPSAQIYHDWRSKDRKIDCIYLALLERSKHILSLDWWASHPDKLSDVEHWLGWVGLREACTLNLPALSDFEQAKGDLGLWAERMKGTKKQDGTFIEVFDLPPTLMALQKDEQAKAWAWLTQYHGDWSFLWTQTISHVKDLKWFDADGRARFYVDDGIKHRMWPALRDLFIRIHESSGRQRHKVCLPWSKHEPILEVTWAERLSERMEFAWNVDNLIDLIDQTQHLGDFMGWNQSWSQPRTPPTYESGMLHFASVDLAIKQDLMTPLEKVKAEIKEHFGSLPATFHARWDRVETALREAIAQDLMMAWGKEETSPKREARTRF